MNTYYIFDTYARNAQGRIMHFDVVLTTQDAMLALRFARDWLAEQGYPDATVAQENCNFCHSSDSLPENLKSVLAAKGFAIYPLEGCPKP